MQMDLCPVIAKTDEKGIVTHLVIDVSRLNFLFEEDEQENAD